MRHRHQTRPSRAFLLGALASVALWLPAAAEAQGLHAGITISDLSGVDGLEPRRGLVLGASLSFLRIGLVSITPEILYIQKGARRETPSAENGIEDVRLDYVEVPILARVGGFIRGTAIQPAVYAGGYFAFEIGCSVGFDDGERSSGCNFAALQELGVDGALDESDAGWIIGGAIEFYLPAIGGLSLDARYSSSFAPITREGSIDEPKHQTITIMLGWNPSLP